MHLLTLNQAKMNKSQGTGYCSAILHLQPAWSYKGVKTCRNLHGTCAGCCVAMTGHGRFNTAMDARERRTKMFVDEHDTFMSLLDADALSLTAKAQKQSETGTCRPNGTSDLLWESYRVPRTRKNIFDSHPTIRWYDYTKDAKRAATLAIANYDLTFSYSERSNADEVREVLKANRNVAIVFGVRRSEELPTRYKVNGRWFDVIDGDVNDLRFLDRKGCIVGLRYKLAFSRKDGKAVAPPDGFVRMPGQELVNVESLRAKADTTLLALISC